VAQVDQVAADGLVVAEVLALPEAITEAIPQLIHHIMVEAVVVEQEAPVVMVDHLVAEGQEEMVFQIQ
jgi:hypothetical protein